MRAAAISVLSCYLIHDSKDVLFSVKVDCLKLHTVVERAQFMQNPRISYHQYRSQDQTAQFFIGCYLDNA